MSRIMRIAALLCVLVVTIPARVSAHGELEGTDPKDGASLKKVPASITVTLTEEPGPGSTMTATDGCGRRVPGDVSLRGADLTAAVESGEPGRWKASYKAISAVDGHLTRGEVAFTVAGNKDCREDKGGNDDPDLAGGEDTRVDNPDPDGDDSSGFPVIPFALGTAVVVVLALILRRAASK